MSCPVWTRYEFYTTDPELQAVLRGLVDDDLHPEEVHGWDAGVLSVGAEINYGYREDIECWCVDNNVAFNVTVNSDFDFQGNCRWWRPGMSTDCPKYGLVGDSVDVDHELEPVIQISMLLAEIEAAASNGPSAKDVLSYLHTWAQGLLPPPLDKCYGEAGES